MTFARALQPENALTGMTSTPCGISISLRALQLQKTLRPKAVNVEGSCASARFPHCSNALAPIDVSPSGKLMLSNAEQSANA